MQKKIHTMIENTAWEGFVAVSWPFTGAQLMLWELGGPSEQLTIKHWTECVVSRIEERLCSHVVRHWENRCWDYV